MRSFVSSDRLVRSSGSSSTSLNSPTSQPELMKLLGGEMKRVLRSPEIPVASIKIYQRVTYGTFIKTWQILILEYCDIPRSLA